MEQNYIERKVADAILEKKVGTLEIEGKQYNIAPPSIATLILVSEIVAGLPIVEKVDNKQIVYSVLHYAKDFKALGEMAAILILGAKECKRSEKKPRFYSIRHFFGYEYVPTKDELAEIILQNVRPTVLFDVIIQRLKDMEVSSFFAITTSLSEANILKPTKEVEQP
nr:hypothetical protein [Prevotella sp.]